MKIKELIEVLSGLPGDSEITMYRNQRRNLEGFWKNIRVSEQVGFYLEDDDGFFEPTDGDEDEETYGRNTKFLIIE
jgi:hypothetical protein